MVTSVAQFIGLAAAVVSIALAIEQLTATGRLRRREAFLRAAADNESPSHSAVLLSLRRDTTAELIARQLVPWHAFIFPTFLAGTVFLSIGLVGRDLSIRRFTDESSTFLAEAFITLPILLLSGLWAIAFVPYLVRERYKIVRSYLREKPVLTGRWSSTWLLQAQQFRERGTLAWGSVRLAVLYLGLVGIAFLVGWAWGTPRGRLLTENIPEALTALVLLPIVAIAIGSLGLTEAYVERHRQLSTHPYPDLAPARPPNPRQRPKFVSKQFRRRRRRS